MAEPFKWECREGGWCLRNPYYCGKCGSVDCKVDQNVMGHKGTCEFITCNACGAVTEVERVLVGARWAAIVAEKRTEQWDAEDAGWNASLESYGVQVVGPGPEWRGRVGFYLRDCANGHALTGMAAVLVTDPQGSGLAVGKRVDVQAWTLRKLPERSITEIVADIRAGK